MLTSWNQWFSDCEPVAHHLPVQFPERWVRFHSLPGSKRYPENESEYATVLMRHNCVLGELARQGETVALLTTGYSETAEPIRSYPELLAMDPLAVPWRTIAMHETEDSFPEPSYWHVFMRERAWMPGEFDPLVRLVADDVVTNVMIVALDCRWLLHPYDGGMDVILGVECGKGLAEITLPGVAIGKGRWAVRWSWCFQHCLPKGSLVHF